MLDLFHRSGSTESVFTRITTKPRGGNWQGEASTGHDATAAIEPAFTEPCFEGMETRLLLDVLDDVRAAYPDLNLSGSYNIIEIGDIRIPDNVSSFAFTEAGLRAAIARAGETAANDLIVVRTTTAQNTIYLSGELVIDFGVVSRGTVTIVSLSPAGETRVPLTIDARNQSRVLRIGGGAYDDIPEDTSSPVVSLAGLTITNGRATEYSNGGACGGGISNGGSLTVTNSTITGNTVTAQRDGTTGHCGGGIYNGENGGLTVTNSAITGNTVIVNTLILSTSSDLNCGGGIYSNNFLTVTNSIIAGNSVSTNRSASGGGIYSISSLTVTNSLITGNTASGAKGAQGGGIYSILRFSFNGLRVTNSTITGNTVSSGVRAEGDGMYITSLLAETGTVMLANTIIVGNGLTDIGQDRSVTGYNNLTTFTGWSNSSSGNLVYNPSLLLFVNAAAGDYRLAANSQAIDKGDNARAASAGLTNSSKDLAGNSRIGNGTIDIGAYEYQHGPTPTTPLATPTGVTANSKNGTTITVGWNAVANASGYTIQYATNAGFTQNVKTQSVSGGSATSADVTGLSADTTYYVRVMATGTGSYTNSAYSGSVSTTTSAAPLVAPASASTSGVGASSVTVSWTSVTGASGYRVEWYVGSTLVSSKIVTGGSVLSTQITGLSASTSYTFRVYTVAGSNTSANYASASATTLADDVTPTPITTNTVAGSVKAKATGISEIVLTWKYKYEAQKDSATWLTVYRYDIYDDKGTRIGSVLANKGFDEVYSFTVNNSRPGVNLRSGTSYSYRVVAVCRTATGAEIVSSKSVTAKAKTLAFAAPKAAKAVKGDVQLMSVTVRWQTQAFADEGYTITWYDAKDKKLTTPLDSQTVAAGVTEFEITGLSPGTKYTYTIVALNNSLPPGVTSAVLKKSVATLKFTAAKKPALVKGSLTSAAANLTWKATALPKTVASLTNPGTVRYELFYTETKGLKPGAAGWTPIPLAGEGEGIVASFTGATAVTLTGLGAGKTYYIYVRSIWSEDAAAFSNSAVLTLKTPR